MLEKTISKLKIVDHKACMAHFTMRSEIVTGSWKKARKAAYTLQNLSTIYPRYNTRSAQLVHIVTIGTSI